MSRPAQALLERPHALPPLSRALMGLTRTVLKWELRHRTRRSLAGLDAHLLHDIGLDEHQAAAEWNKPFWWR